MKETLGWPGIHELEHALDAGSRGSMSVIFGISWGRTRLGLRRAGSDLVGLRDKDFTNSNTYARLFYEELDDAQG